ncbi:MAG: hypothetical protein V1707_00590 [bacterium]
MFEIFHKLFRFLFPHSNPIDIKRRYGLPDGLSIHIKMTNDGWLVATAPDLPGLVTQARNRVELLEMVNDAVLTYFDVPKREADVVYDQLLSEDGQLVEYRSKLQTRTT